MVGKFLKTAVRRDAIAPLLGIIGVVALAWLWLLVGAGMDSTMVAMTRMGYAVADHLSIKWHRQIKPLGKAFNCMCMES